MVDYYDEDDWTPFTDSENEVDCPRCYGRGVVLDLLTGGPEFLDKVCPTCGGDQYYYNDWDVDNEG